MDADRIKQRDFHNRIYSFEDSVKAALAKVSVDDLRKRAKGQDKVMIDQSCWWKLTTYSGISQDNAEAFLKSYESLVDVVVRVSPKRQAEANKKALEGIKEALEGFMKDSPALFTEVDTWVNALSLEGRKAKPAFDIADFETNLRRAKGFNPRGNLTELHNKLGNVRFLAYLEEEEA